MSTSIPEQQTAAVKQGFGAEATTSIKQIPVQKPGPGQILVKILYSGLCASDTSLIYDEWAPFGVAMGDASRGVAGHEGAGVVVAVGADVPSTLWKEGDRAGIKWVASVCGVCAMCKDAENGLEAQCIGQTNSGLTTAGTFQEYCLADAKYTTHIPDGVSDEEAGPLMCGGLTAYTACKRSKVKPGGYIVLPGAGGGLGHLAVQYAKAMGMRVIAVDGGQQKKDLCMKLGAEAFIDFTTEKDIAAAVMKMTGGFGAHGVIVTAASKAGYESAPSFLRPGGTMVAVGLPADPTVIAGCRPGMLVMKKLNIVGSCVGSLQDVEECLDFTARGLVHPVLTKGTLKDLPDLMHKMQEGTLAGRAVVKVSA